MPRPFSVALIATLCLIAAARAEDKPSPAVKRILDKAVGKVRTNRTEFDKANKRPLDEARQELQDLSTKLIKDGKTEEAGVVLKQVGTLDADVMKMANAPAPMAGGGAVPQKPLLERLEGSWGHANLKWTTVIEVSGTIREVDAEGRVFNQGRITQKDADVGEAILSSGHKLHLRPAGNDALAVLVWEPNGKPSGDGRCLGRLK